MGGNRKGKFRTILNLMATMLIGGLWHGASWQFVIWGGLHGLYLVAEKLISNSKIGLKKVWDLTIIRLCLAMTTYFFVCLAWVFFRAKTLPRACDLLVSLFDFNHLLIEGNIGRLDCLCVLIITLVMLSIHWWLRDSNLENLFARIPFWLKSVIISMMLYCILTSFAGENRAFIYFQF